MDPKHALHTSQTHPFVDGIENLCPGGLTMRYWLGIGVEAATTNLTQVRLGPVFGFSIFDRLDAVTGWALRHPDITSRRRSHYPIMELELPRPKGHDWSSLLRVWPTFLAYILSFVFVGLAWTNHHLLRGVRRVSNGVMWANLNLLFWLSMLPFVTDWAGETHFAPVPMTVYAADALLGATAFSVLIHVIQRDPGDHPQGLSRRGKIAASLAAHVVSVVAPVVSPAGVWVSGLCLVFVALTWLVPDRRSGQAVEKESGRGHTVLAGEPR